MERKALTLYIGLGFEFAGLVVACLFIGNWLDSKFGWGGLGVAGGAFTGLGIWILHLVTVMKALEKQKQEESSAQE